MYRNDLERIDQALKSRNLVWRLTTEHWELTSLEDLDEYTEKESPIIRTASLYFGEAAIDIKIDVEGKLSDGPSDGTSGAFLEVGNILRGRQRMFGLLP